MKWDERYDFYGYTEADMEDCLRRYIPHKIICTRNLAFPSKAPDFDCVFEVIEELNDGTRRTNVYFPFGLGSYAFSWIDIYGNVYLGRNRQRMEEF